MTTRDGTLGRQPVRVDPVPSLPRQLHAARERKGVDLARAERDTKIRARYLEALERGDWRALPGQVYTKGFLRNYAIYLGLEPDQVLRDWRRERGDTPDAQAMTVPRALKWSRPARTIPMGVVWAALLALGVIAFGVYLGVQLLRFAKPPTLSVADPVAAVSTVGASTTKYVLRGTSIPGAEIVVATPGREQPYRGATGPDGSWSVEVDLLRGRNQFNVSAVDPETRKSSETDAHLLITVPLP